jgi:enoyl-CoA hydratase/carnithine racemase
MLLRISRSLFSTSAELVRVQKLKDKYSNIVSIELNQPKKKNALSIALLNQVPLDILLA